MPARFADTRRPRADARSAVDPMRRWPRLACRWSPARTRRRPSPRSRPVRRPRPVPTREPLAGPRRAARAPLQSTVWSGKHLVPSMPSLRRGSMAKRRGEGRGRPRHVPLGPLGAVASRLDSFRSRSRPFSPLLSLPSRPLPLTAITRNHDEPPISHNLPRKLATFLSETDWPKGGVPYASDKLSSRKCR